MLRQTVEVFDGWVPHKLYRATLSTGNCESRSDENDMNDNGKIQEPAPDLLRPQTPQHQCHGNLQDQFP
jgi:hypothetical protein